MTKPLSTTTLHTWGKWLSYLLLMVVGACAGHFSRLIAGKNFLSLTILLGPITPEAVGLVTVQLYGMVLLLILMLLSRRFFPKVAPYIAFFAIGFVINALLEGMLFAYVHLYEGSFFGPPN